MRERTINFWRISAWVFGALVVSGVVWAGVGGPVVTNSDTGTAIPEKLGKDPAPGRVLQLPTGTDQRGAYWRDLPQSTGLGIGHSGELPFMTAPGTGTTTNWVLRLPQEADIPNLVTDLAGKEPLSSGTPGKAVCFTGTGTSTVTAKGACALSTFTGGTLQAGSNIGLSTGTSTSVGTSPASLADSPTIHVVDIMGTNLPVSVGTSTANSAGVGTRAAHRDHVHACDLATPSSQGCMSGGDKGNLDILVSNSGKAKAYSSSAYQYISDSLTSSDSSVVLAQYGSGTSAKLDVRITDATPKAHASTHALGGSDIPLGMLVNRYEFTRSTSWAPSTSSSWEIVDPHTFTAAGSKFTVTAHVTFSGNANSPSYNHLCGLGIAANTGSSAYNLRGPQTWVGASPSTAAAFANATIWDSNVNFLGTGLAISEFNLSEGTVTISAAVYRYESTVPASCSIEAYNLTVYVDVYK